ncbi:MAG: adenosylmethionine decarboxylase [Candidatus Calescibacterium sp.]|nr:adenosylmethionine decarboxylase [Candidatus Calescibacterium sp.]MCX7733546.1 adenosylmethionine decarboxylase [bacterium]MDW8087260.1 adenosylmethionine decarboxylase [Candidatus Calescibacterium sp.]
MAKKFLGIHIIAELHGCDPVLLDDEKYITDILLQAAKDTKVTVVDYVTRKFDPQGVSVVIIVSESHIAIHTWPELRYAALDFYTCGEEDPESAVREVAEKLGTKDFVLFRAERGNVRKIRNINSKIKEIGDADKRSEQIQILL